MYAFYQVMQPSLKGGFLIIRKSAIKKYLAATLLMAGIFLGYSLTAMLSIAVGFVVLMLFSKKKFIFMPLILAVAIILVFGGDLILVRFSELFANLSDFSPGSTEYGTSTSFYVRSLAWAAGIEAFAASPVFGIGLGQGEIPFDSSLITIAAEMGVVGLFLYYLLPLIVIYRLNKIRKTFKIAEVLISLLVADYVNGFVTHHGFHLQRWLLVSFVCGWLLFIKATQKRLNYLSKSDPSNDTSSVRSDNAAPAL